MAPNDEYTRALEKAVTDLQERVQRRDVLNAEIAGLRETVRVLSSRISLSKEEREGVGRLLDMVDYATPNLRDSIRAILTRAYPKKMTAVEVRDALEGAQFNFDEFSNSLSACHATLKRMHNDEELDIETQYGKTAYGRVMRLTPPPEPFTKLTALTGILGGLGGGLDGPGPMFGKVKK
jgi:SMC interacting uncharacterized protein involved in chromosome segregation